VLKSKTRCGRAAGDDCRKKIVLLARLPPVGETHVHCATHGHVGDREQHQAFNDIGTNAVKQVADQYERQVFSVCSGADIPLASSLRDERLPEGPRFACESLDLTQ
jgi:hypothetical protein